MKLSVVVSAYNEEKNIGECLKSVERLADEIIVVDNDSNDNTGKIAKKFTEKVFSQKNNPQKIDLQKNFGFDKATGDWILTLDADERITPELAKEIKIKIENSHVSGYWIPRKNIIFGKWIKSEMWWPDYQLKLFKKGKGGFDKNQVHKALRVEGNTDKLENFLIHNNYVSVSQYIQKLNNYTDIESQNLFSQGYKFSWADSIRFPVDDFLKTFFLQKGYREGLHGLVLSVLQAFYMEMVFLKLWEKEGFREDEAVSLREMKKEFKKTKNKITYWFLTSSIRDVKNPVKKLILRAARKITSRNLKNP
ncbi:MAG: glycosyltransferase family 2 protein [bacterium]|nr:glycosyltransferase family 2 protein [bacterium]